VKGTFDNSIGSTAIAETTALLDVLVYERRHADAPATGNFSCPLDASIVSAIRDRAQRLDIAVSRIHRAALAILDSRLTGNSLVSIRESASSSKIVTFVLPANGSLDDWLSGGSQDGYVPAMNASQRPEPPPSAIGSWTGDSGNVPPATGLPLVWHLEPTGNTTLSAIFSESLFDEASVALLAAGLVQVLKCLGTCEQIEAVSAIDDAQRERMLVAWNATAVARRRDDTVHGLFTAAARRHPERRAVEWPGGSATYAEVDARSDRVAAGLQVSGVSAGSIVALLLDRSIDAIVAMLGILKVGAAYMPLDATNPDEHLSFAIRDSRATIVIVASGARAPERITAQSTSLDDLESSREPPTAPVSGDETRAYVMHTSGSTGAPKGVEIGHRSIVRLVRDVDYVEFGEQPRVLHAAPLGFDASTFEIWGALLNGGTCVIHDERIPSGPALAATIARHDVRIAWLTAALFNAIIDEDANHLCGLAQLLIGGEALSVSHVRAAYAALPDVVIINGYGPTECTTFAATYRIPRDLDAGMHSVPIGRPIANTTLYVVNARGEPVPVGVVGELHIGGAGLARGYLGRADLTGERFRPNPFDTASERLYRTGDLVRWLPEGVVEFVGRLDGQIKLRGYRIETAAIEAALQQLRGVRACAVIAREDQPGQKRLVAYYVADGAGVTRAKLREQLAGTLPDFMVPASYVQVDALPVTDNGKLDRRSLPAPDKRRPPLANAFEAAIGETERRLCDLFAEVLDLEGIGRRDNFFDLGGNSLLAVKAVARINNEISRTPTITTFFRDPRPAALAAAITDRAEPSVPIARAKDGHRDGDTQPIAIIAMAGRFPGAADVEEFWRNLCGARETITFFDAGALDSGVGSEQHDPDYVRARGVIDGIEDFDAAFFGITAREAELMDPQQRVFLELCWECLERGGYVPDVHAAPVGVFGGMHNATYFQRHVGTRPDLVDKLGAFQTMLGNEKDYLATRVAHKLNLAGPAISINTACSTSLVAICQACDALRSGQCVMALAGGVAVNCPPRSGYMHQDGSMLSPDGHTRSFDADAQGTVFSDGAAVVLLKPLSDALADGDQIHAVIRGVAVNNDGGIKASFTAPSSAGQAAVIAGALANAGVEARSISYVETHGTATPIGDPIEIEGLTSAFRRSTDDRGFCAIGSLKSNVGHLVTAAGAAGVIKAALALSERELPASLHMRTPNPNIDFANSPFFVNDQTQPWRADGPLRAGVSSFGVGGTNAHVILEEPPPREPSISTDGEHLLLLSARTPQALKSAVTRLGEHLADHPQAALADIAYTLAVGRKAFAQRTFVVAADCADAVAQIGSVGIADRMYRSDSAPAVVFMFPGQGSQYAGMGRGLYASEPVFRSVLDQCCENLRGELGFDLREHIFSADADALRETALTQPATFAIEYALARLWISVGIRPAAMIGHSVGEFVAAAIAGVMDVANAARLVARRGRLMQAQPAGAMLSVRLDEKNLAGRLPASLSLAAVNAPNSCVVSGEIQPIATLQEELQAAGIASRLLHTSH
ncbi:MAG: amino acid adenylation domain-containing protein, partial [Rhodanobacteraceae bacterium]